LKVSSAFTNTSGISESSHWFQALSLSTSSLDEGSIKSLYETKTRVELKVS
jgi:hypothetical protein